MESNRLIQNRTIKLTNDLLATGYAQSSHYYFFTLIKEEALVVVLVYVYDFLITSSNMQMIDEVNRALHQQFKLKDLGELKYFLS